MNKEDDKSFADLMQDVIPLQATSRVTPTKQTPKPLAAFTQLEQQSILSESLSAPNFNEIDTGDTLSWHQPGIQKSVIKKLRRGQYSVKDELDLHGLNQNQAKQAVSGFLNAARLHDHSCVRIIHGKGNRSAQGPVLKRAIGGWLVKRKDVIAFASAPSHDGGTGAIYVLLRTHK